MANSLDSYIHVRYANEALNALESAIGMAKTVRRNLDKSPNEKGKVTQIEVPSVFSAATMPVSTSNISTQKVDISLDQWYGVTFAVADDELNYTSTRLIEDHIRPAAYAVAKQIDSSLNGLYAEVPWQIAAGTGTPTVVSDFTRAERILFDNGVPDMDRWYEVGGERREEYLGQSLFHQANTGANGADVQVNGNLGKKFTLNVFGNQNVASHTAGALTAGTALQLNAGIAAGATSAVFKDSGGSLSGTVKAGDTFTIAGNTQSYTITADATAASNLITVSFSPGAAAAASTSAVVTLTQTSGTQNLAYHRDAFALVMTPLTDLGDMQGGRVQTVFDPSSGLTLRLTFWTDFANAKNLARVDALWGVKTLYQNAAVRVVNS